MEKTEIIILAAGKGTRMESELPKCLVSIKGIPMIERLLSGIEKSLVNKPLIVVGHKAEEVEKYLAGKARFVRQLEQKGTAHAAQTALQALLPTTEHVIILYADHPFVSADTIEKLISELSQKTVAIAVTDAADFGGWKSLFRHWGRIVYSKDGSIDRITEYKDADDSVRALSKVNPGFYAFNAVWLASTLEKVKPINAQGEYYLTDVIKMAREENLEIGEVVIEPFEAMGVNSKSEVEYAESLL